MKDKVILSSSIAALFLCGCLFGSYCLLMHLRINALESNQAMFQKNVEVFAKQINDEFSKRPIKEDKRKD